MAGDNPLLGEPKHSAGEGASSLPAAPTKRLTALDFPTLWPPEPARTHRAFSSSQVAELFEHRWLNYLTRDTSAQVHCADS